MSDRQQSPESVIPLTPAVFHILLSLVDQERHGYGIMQEVARQSDGRVRIGPGTLYGSIKRMLAAGLIVETEGPSQNEPDDGRRRYYRLTGHGRRVAHAEARRLASLVEAAQQKRLLPEETAASKQAITL